MKKLILVALITALLPAISQAGLNSTAFLKTGTLPRLNQDYFDTMYAEGYIGFTQPSGGAVIKILGYGGVNYDTRHYIFCDNPTHRLLIYSLIDSAGVRRPLSVKAFGKQVADPWFFAPEDSTATTLEFTAPDRSGNFHFDRPVDVTTSSNGRYFDVQTDRIYVLDQASPRIIILRYDAAADSLIGWDTFGSDILEFPTAIAYADYGDGVNDNDDIYVTDAMASKVFRFSALGVYETYFGGWAKDMSGMAYPGGVAVAPYNLLANRIYVSDSHNHRVVRYYSASYGPIIAECQYIFPLTPMPLISNIATDNYGFVYVVDSFRNNITRLNSSLNQIEKPYGTLGYNPGQFDFPSDIYIDGDEMQVCEQWADSSGIQSFEISREFAKMESGELPYTFQLHQNYPNPFNSNTIILFDLERTGIVSLTVYNILGQRVTTLINSELPAGRHSVTWDGRNQSRDKVSSGVYFYVLNQNENRDVKKLLLLK
jgi:hypothetical protein